MYPSSRGRPTSRAFNYTTSEAVPGLIAFERLMLFVEEMIDYSLRENNLSNWIPPMNLQFLRLQCPTHRYFDDRIGKAIAHSCMEGNAVSSAMRHGFDQEMWLTLKPEEATEQMVGYFGKMLTQAQVPEDLTALQVFSFGCCVARVAMKRRLNVMANAVVQALVRTCCIHFPYEREYVGYSIKAETYNLEHTCHERFRKCDERFEFD